VCAGGLNIQKIDKTQLIYSVSYFNLGGLKLCFGGLSPPKLLPWWRDCVWAVPD